jgi:hypothetical protein
VRSESRRAINKADVLRVDAERLLERPARVVDDLWEGRSPPAVAVSTGEQEDPAPRSTPGEVSLEALRRGWELEETYHGRAYVFRWVGGRGAGPCFATEDAAITWMAGEFSGDHPGAV